MCWIFLLAALAQSVNVDGIEYLWGHFKDAPSTQVDHFYVQQDQKCDNLGTEITIKKRVAISSYNAEVRTIQQFAFRNCAQIETVHLPDTIKLIQAGAFIKCTSLRTITMAGNVETINLPFEYCASLSIFYCGTEPTFTGNIARTDDMNTFQVYVTSNYDGTEFGGVPSANVKKSSGCGLFVPYQQDNVKFEFDGSVLVVSGSGQANGGYDKALTNICSSCSVTDGKNAIQKIEFKDSVTGVGASAFANLANLQEVVPGPVTALSAGCFEGCTKLNNVHFRTAAFTTISECAFKGCTALGNISLPTTLQSIGSEAFMNSGLSSVEFLGSKMQNMGTGAFRGCTKLAKFVWPSQVTTVSDFLFKDCKSFGGYTMPASIKSIGVEAFSGTIITRLEVPDDSQLSTIGWAAFFDCDSLAFVKLHSGVTSIGGNAFKSCNSLSSVHIKGTDKRLSVRENAFSDCTKGITIYYCRSAEATFTGTGSVFGGTQTTIYVHQGYKLSQFAGAGISRVGSDNEIFVPVTQDGLTYTFDGSKLTITGTGTATGGNIESATKGQCGACTGTLTNVQELFLESTVGLSNNLFQGCSNLQKVTYCGITPPEVSRLFANNQVEVHVPSIYDGDTFGGCSVTKSTDVDDICKIETPTPVESFETSDFSTATIDPIDPTSTFDPIDDPTSMIETIDDPTSMVETIDPTSIFEESQTPTEEEITATSENDDKQESVQPASNTGLIAGLVVGLLLLVVLVLLLIWLFAIRRRKEQSQVTEHELPEETIDNTTSTESVYGTVMNETEANPLFAQEFDPDEFRQSYEEYRF